VKGLPAMRQSVRKIFEDERGALQISGSVYETEMAI
jgi:hypothetical protein